MKFFEKVAAETAENPDLTSGPVVNPQGEEREQNNFAQGTH
jgi:hypothetical protein